MPEEEVTDAAVATIIETLDKARTRLTDAERMAKGAQNDDAIAEIVRVTRMHNRILRHVARSLKIERETLT